MKWLMLGMGLLVFGFVPAQGSEGDPTSIVYVVTWRGITAAEEGFVSYLEESEIPVEFVFRDANRDRGELALIRQEIQEIQPDLIYAFGTTASVDLVGTMDHAGSEGVIKDIPLVFNIVADPLGAGLVSDLSGSGRNVTGTSHLATLETQLNAIKALGDFQNIGTIYNPLERNSALVITQLGELMRDNGMSLVAQPLPIVDDAPDLSEFENIARGLISQGVEFIYLPSDSFVISHADLIVSTFHRLGLPTFSATEGPIRENGAFIGIVSTYFAVGRFAGFRAEQILSGQWVGEIPIETLARFTYLVNLGAMREVAFYPPLAVLQFAETID